MSTIHRIGLIAIFCCLACWRVGKTAADLNLAQSPNGATVSVLTSTLQVDGELLAVRDDGIVILHGSRMTLIPYGSVRRARVKELSDYSIGAGTPSPDRRARLNSLSRYPQGIGPELQRKLFAQLGQTELEVLR
jgi:hypothetical protein